MVVVALCLNSQCQFISFVCPPGDEPAFQCDTYPTSCSAWTVPQSAILPLAYWIIEEALRLGAADLWGKLLLGISGLLVALIVSGVFKLV